MLPASPEALALLLVLVFLVAAAYASVGHGGASGYLAVLSFFGLAPAAMASGALMLNLLVAGLSFQAYYRAGHFRWRLLWPFLVASIPAAFIGGLVNVPSKAYMAVLGAVLVFAALRLAFAADAREAGTPVADEPGRLPLAAALPAGAGIGFLSGLIGVGGGIFLSPLLILMKWADTRRTAAVSAAFIWINSAAGLYGHLSRWTLNWRELAWLVAAAFAGGLTGSQLGARRFGGLWQRRILAAVLLLAAVKLFRTAF